ncbi:MAG: hypothetical protein M3O36_13945, partial [Myxococcota bacterium]|nr:hypothetical protein [Myxococcota bacterium]
MNSGRQVHGTQRARTPGAGWTFRALAATCFPTAAVCWPSYAEGSGLSAAHFGGDLGNVTTTSPTAMYYNPAGIAASSGTAIFADWTLAIRRATYSHAAAPSDVPDPPGRAGANTGRASLFNVFGGPMAAITTRLGDGAIGAALTVPFGGQAKWDKNERLSGSAFPLAVDGVQRWHQIDAMFTVIYLTAGGAYRLG